VVAGGELTPAVPRWLGCLTPISLSTRLRICVPAYGCLRELERDATGSEPCGCRSPVVDVAWARWTLMSRFVQSHVRCRRFDGPHR
jgi:hypothetical protein